MAAARGLMACQYPPYNVTPRRTVVDILTFIVVCVVVGVALWVINAYVPMAPDVKKVLNIGVVVLLVLWLAVSILGMTNLGSVRID